MEARGSTDIEVMVGVEPMEDAEEEKSVPPDLTQNTSHGEDGSGGKTDALPRRKKKRVHFDSDVKRTGSKDAHQGKDSDHGNKSQHIPTGKSEMVYVVKKPLVEEVKNQPIATVSKEDTKMAGEAPKQGNNDNSKRESTTTQSHTASKRKNAGGDNTTTNDGSTKGPRRDAEVEERKHRKSSSRDPKKVLQSCDEFTIVNYNVRGINTEEKQRKVYKILGRYRPQLVCLNETKLQSPLFLDRYRSFQTNAQRHGGYWTASLTNAKLSLVKTMGTHLCWTQLEIGRHIVLVLNCYI
jgi:hypothetical protein